MLKSAVSAAIERCRQFQFLVLRRKHRDSIYVDGPCVITIVSQSARGVSLGFQAPATTRIVRTEIAEHPANSDHPSPLGRIVAQVIESHGDHQEVS